MNLLHRCHICDLDVDLHCANYPPPGVIDNLETHDHKLIFVQERVEFECDAKCGKVGEGFPYKCSECDLAFHVHCLLNPSEVNAVFAEDGYTRNCFIIALLVTSAWICVVF